MNITFYDGGGQWIAHVTANFNEPVIIPKEANFFMITPVPITGEGVITLPPRGTDNDVRD